MQPITMIVARGEEKEGVDSTLISLLISLLVLVLCGLLLVGGLLFLRKMRKAKKEAELPLYEKRNSNRRLTITASPYAKGPVTVYHENVDLMSNGSAPSSPVPEIRITFPDEVDEAGKRQAGRVLVVRVGEHSVGLEPLPDHLPPYQRDATDRFDSLDLDRIGGLKEKNEKDDYYS